MQSVSQKALLEWIESHESKHAGIRDCCLEKLNLRVADVAEKTGVCPDCKKNYTNVVPLEKLYNQIVAKKSQKTNPIWIDAILAVGALYALLSIVNIFKRFGVL